MQDLSVEMLLILNDFYQSESPDNYLPFGAVWPLCSIEPDVASSFFTNNLRLFYCGVEYLQVAKSIPSVNGDAANLLI